MYETPDVGEGERRDFENDDNEDEKSELELMIEREQEIRFGNVYITYAMTQIFIYRCFETSGAMDYRTLHI